MKYVMPPFSDDKDIMQPEKAFAGDGRIDFVIQDGQWIILEYPKVYFDR